MVEYTYEIYKNSQDDDVIKRTDSDGKVWFIPTDPANADYQAYLNKDTLPSNSSTPQAGN